MAEQEQAAAPAAEASSAPRRSRRSKGNHKKNQTTTTAPTATNQHPQAKKNNNNNKRKRKPHYPWRKYIPQGSEDPISLEPLRSLPYPPFALYAQPPHNPISAWPPQEQEVDETHRAQEDDQQQEDRQLTILREQWGNQTTAFADGNSSQEQETKQEQEPQNKNRHVHLFDGHALAVYMVSQLQFIDPLNRRDLTRAELVNLDGYLKRHAHAIRRHEDQKQNDASVLQVTPVYDAKGTTLSRAGSAAATAEGRAALLQQEALVLYNSLFSHAGRRGGTNISTNPRQQQQNSRRSNENTSHNDVSPSSAQSSSVPTTTSSTLSDAYLAHTQRQQQQAGRDHQSTVPPFSSNDVGVYGDEDGIMIIDDDINPGLRGNSDIVEALRTMNHASSSSSSSEEDEEAARPARIAPGSFSLWSTGRLDAQLGRGRRSGPQFPSLDHRQEQHTRRQPKSAALAKIAVSRTNNARNPQSRNPWGGSTAL